MEAKYNTGIVASIFLPELNWIYEHVSSPAETSQREKPDGRQSHSEILRTLRKRRRLSQQALAEATRGRNKVGVATIKRIEAADGEYEAHSRVAKALAQALHVSVEDLAKEPQDRET